MCAVFPLLPTTGRHLGLGLYIRVNIEGLKSSEYLNSTVMYLNDIFRYKIKVWENKAFMETVAFG